MTSSAWTWRVIPMVACATALFGVGALLSCVSERTTGTTVDTGSCGVDLPAEAFGSTVVVIKNFAFTPATVRVRPGTKVTWVNCEPPGTDAHTTTSDAGVWSSALLPPKATYTQLLNTAGSYPYHCTPHPGMTGTVTVE
jgi:plastocyanin